MSFLRDSWHISIRAIDAGVPAMLVKRFDRKAIEQVMP